MVYLINSTNIYLAGHREKEPGAICTDDLRVGHDGLFAFGTDSDRDRVALSREGMVNAYIDGASGDILGLGLPTVIVAESPFLRSRQTNTQRLLGAGYDPLDAARVDITTLDQLGFHGMTFPLALDAIYSGEKPLTTAFQEGYYFQRENNAFCFSELIHRVADAFVRQYEGKLKSHLVGERGINFGIETHSDPLSAFWAGLFLGEHFSVDENRKSVAISDVGFDYIDLFKRSEFIRAALVGGTLDNPIFSFCKRKRAQAESSLESTLKSLDDLKRLRDVTGEHAQIQL